VNARIFSSLSDPDLAAALLQGAVGVIPTDTVYGLVAKASESSAIDRLYRSKPRPLQPGTIIGSCLADFEELGFRADELELCNKFWPAAVSVVLNATNVAHFLKKDRATLPVRLPADVQLVALLEQTGALMTSSANLPGQPTATSIEAARQYFGESVDFYVDVGDLGDRPPSTIIGFDNNKQIVVHRHGAVDITTL